MNSKKYVLEPNILSLQYDLTYSFLVKLRVYLFESFRLNSTCVGMDYSRVEHLTMLSSLLDFLCLVLLSF